MIYIKPITDEDRGKFLVIPDMIVFNTYEEAYAYLRMYKLSDKKLNSK